jgi:hypothetical protein
MKKLELNQMEKFEFMFFKKNNLHNIKIIFGVVFLLCSLFSCTEDKSESKINSNVIVSSIKKINNIDEQRIAFNLLNSEEKLLVWSDKLNLILEDPNINNAQKTLIIELKNNLKPCCFKDETNDEKEYFKNIYVVNYLKEIDKVFTREQIEKIFYNLYDYRIADNTKKSCNCNKGSLFGCGASASCKNKTCTDSNSGCGFMWAWECNGICELTDF